MTLSQTLVAIIVAMLVASALAAWLLRGDGKRRVPRPRNCPACKRRQGVRGRPIHITPVDGYASWAILCESCWERMSRHGRYEHYAMQAQRWGIYGTPEWASVIASLQVGL